ncbi:MAG: ABC transporter permease subunit [Neisseriaceae bacterium]|nr:ABC transporter permease subunit [Neisseriaceae bacterium]MBP6861772.1 ABC transporter permease subunit [Neisseriaceae bacterium]
MNALRQWWGTALCTLPFVVLMLLFLVAPLLWVAVSAFQNEQGQWSIAAFIEIGGNPFYQQALWQSLQLSFLPSVVGLVVGLMGAYALYQVRDSLFGQLVLSFNSVLSNFTGVPLAFAFIIVLGSNGVVSLLLQMAGVENVPDIYTLSGLMLVYVYFQIPLAILLLYPAIASLKAEWRESAALLGASRWAYWRHIGLPILWPALLATLVVLFANALGAYATTYALTTGNFNILPIRIASLVAGNFSLEPNLAAAIALLLLGVMLLTMLINQWLQRHFGGHS